MWQHLSIQSSGDLRGVFPTSVNAAVLMPERMGFFLVVKQFVLCCFHVKATSCSIVIISWKHRLLLHYCCCLMATLLFSCFFGTFFTFRPFKYFFIHDLPTLCAVLTKFRGNFYVSTTIKEQMNTNKFNYLLVWNNWNPLFPSFLSPCCLQIDTDVNTNS